MINLAVIGAGARALKYLDYVERIPQRARLVAVAEPNPVRRNVVCERFGLDKNAAFGTWDELIHSNLAVDAALVCTPDNLHYEPVMQAVGRGWHVLLEKPIAPNFKECCEIAALAAERGVKVGVCYVMRFFPCYMAVKELLQKGKLGVVMTVTHREAVGIDRMTHAFVRGIWRNEQTSSPLILSKTCHDLDMLFWLTGLRMRRIASLGSLRWFKPENAPQGAASRCVDCSIEHGCRFSAVNLYLRRRLFLQHFDDSSSEGIRRQLETSPYGRCVFHCDNDVVDGQSVIMEMEGGALVTLMLDVFSDDDCRTTHIMGTKGEVKFTETRYDYTDFCTGDSRSADFSAAGEYSKYHYGADHAVVEDFISSIEEDRPPKTDIASAIESHRLAFEAEVFRKEKR